MLWHLLVKDLRRARRNPWPYLLHLALPLVITGLIGLAFGGGGSKDEGLGKIKLAIVDEDESVLSHFLRGALNQGEAKRYLEPQFVSRSDAMRLIQDNKISAIWILPSGMTKNFLTGNAKVDFELIKNPAQNFYPAILEELLQVAVTGLNAVARNLRPDFPEWLAVIEKQGMPDMNAVAKLVERLGKRFETAGKYLFPPLVGYKTQSVKKEEAPGSGAAGNIFAYLLPGLAAMFLLFVADTSVRDLYREVRTRTFERFRTLHPGALPFVISKVLLTITVLSIAGAILFVGGALIFGIRWGHPLTIALLVLAYALFAAGLMTAIAALAKSERRADAFNGAIALGISLVGGSTFPARELPPLFSQHISPAMPTYWFIEAVRSLESGGAAVLWTWPLAKLALLGAILVLFAAWRLQRTLEKGVKE